MYFSDESTPLSRNFKLKAHMCIFYTDLREQQTTLPGSSNITVSVT